jgi:CDP-diacylglycerol--serine O-phosphatidyltransferase
MSERLNSMRIRIRRLKTLPVLPTLLTAGNLASGITAILCAAHDMLEAGAVMVFVAMVCDMLDGKVARMTKTDGPFGAELDSLSDVVSFGVAPAILAHRLLLGEPGVFDHGQRLLWFLTVVYPVMAAIRLARYNVEHSDTATTSFRGLPSPGAAAVVCSWIILHYHQDILHSIPVAYLGAAQDHEHIYKYVSLETLDAYRWIFIAITFISALMMVSTVRYPHIGNTLFGRLGFRHFIIIFLMISVLVLVPQYFLVVVTTVYLLSGLAWEGHAMWTKWRLGRNLLEDAEEDEAEDAGVSGQKDESSGPRPGR